MNLLWGAFFSRGLSGLVAMSASSASQLVFGEQLNSWWDTPAATWNTPRDLWSSSTSCKSGMSSREGWLVAITVKMREEQRFHKSRMQGIVAFQDFTVVHVAPGWGRQVLVTLKGVKGLVHSHNVLLSCPQNRILVTLLSFLHHILVIGCWRQKRANDVNLHNNAMRFILYSTRNVSGNCCLIPVVITGFTVTYYRNRNICINYTLIKMSLTKGNEQWSWLKAVIAKLWTWIRAKYLSPVFPLGFTEILRGRNLLGEKKGQTRFFFFCTRSKSSSAQNRHRTNTQKGCVSEILCLCTDTEYLCSGHVTRCVEALFINLKRVARMRTRAHSFTTA